MYRSNLKRITSKYNVVEYCVSYINTIVSLNMDIYIWQKAAVYVQHTQL